MQRTNYSSAEAQMIKCIDCGDPMYAIYGRAAREICWDCGGEIKHESERNAATPVQVATK